MWLAGGSVVVQEWSGSSYHGALRQQWQPRALTDSGHYHLLSAPFASGQEHLTLPVVTKCCWTAGCEVKYSLSRSGGFPPTLKARRLGFVFLTRLCRSGLLLDNVMDLNRICIPYHKISEKIQPQCG